MRYQKLTNRLYSVNLHTGKTNFLFGRDVLCFLLVEHPCTEEFIQEQALQLLLSQCSSFDFYGAYSKQWDIGFDLVDIMLHPNGEGIALTSQWDDFDGFMEALELAVSVRSIVPFDVYLIYDDNALYNQVLDRLREFECIKRYNPNW